MTVAWKGRAEGEMKIDYSRLHSKRRRSILLLAGLVALFGLFNPNINLLEKVLGLAVCLIVALIAIPWIK